MSSQAQCTAKQGLLKLIKPKAKMLPISTGVNLKNNIGASAGLQESYRCISCARSKVITTCHPLILMG